MGYSGYKDKDSLDILNKYQLIKESNKISNEQTLNEVAGVLIPAGAALWNWIAAAGVTGGLLALLQQAFPPEVVKQMENQLSNIANQFNSLASATTTAAEIASVKALAATLSASSVPFIKSLAPVFTGLAELLTAVEQDSVTEEEAINKFNQLEEQFYGTATSSLNQIKFNTDSNVAAIQKQIAKFITIEMTKDQKEDLRKSQEWSKTLKRNAPSQPQSPQQPPDNKEPKGWKDWFKQQWKNRKWTRRGIKIFGLIILAANIQTVYNVAGLVGKIPGVKPVVGAIGSAAAWGANTLLGRKSGEDIDTWLLRRGAEAVGEPVKTPEKHQDDLDKGLQDLQRMFPNVWGPQKNKKTIEVAPRTNS